MDHVLKSVPGETNSLALPARFALAEPWKPISQDDSELSA